MTVERSAFHVDLRGIVDVLSHHLYSSPRVYLRELVQNAVDAITARTAEEPDAPRRVEITPADVSDDGALHITDTGIGLDENGIRTVLATIGGSTKRDDLGFARESFLGQFGIGLLSCFLVSDEIRLLTRAEGRPTLEWNGSADGTYAVRPADRERREVGTEVVLAGRSGDRGLLETEAVLELARQFASHLPVELVVVTTDGPVEVAGQAFPWESDDALADRCEAELGFRPLDSIRLSEPAAGLDGVAWVLPSGGAPRGRHRVYAKRMLVGDSDAGVLPEWAFFVRTVVDTDHLRLTASRESLHEDEVLEETRDRIGAQLRDWLLDLVQRDPERARVFFAEHHLAVKAMALQDDAMLDILVDLFEWETSTGRSTLADVAQVERVLTYVTSVEDFHQVAPIARAQDLTVLNAGYAYDDRILARWLARQPDVEGRHLAPSDLTTEFTELEPQEEDRFAALLDMAHQVLARAGCRPVARGFSPTRLQAVLLSNRAADQQLDRAVVLDRSSGPWAAALATQDRPQDLPTFVLNARNPALRRLVDLGDEDLQRAAVEALYAQALYAGQHPLRPFDSALVARALPNLIDLAINRTAGDPA
ncbi:HSP90 family protein [Luteipulveratus flavus]|uniref:HSP90 family protein n=1 Tax=Luteipulveratus flavus TaxID=3031728 RepID=A0ABT6C480_9MICO|nr:HSP90 family protein [Luteipulveratus sp. YIM 133296]MDF8263675.1 HSP90 family protein [Luteipulveratus sp. YIM 133296]